MHRERPKTELIELECILLGPTAAGKSALLQRLCKDQFAPEYAPTIIMDFRTREFVTLQHHITLKAWEAGSDGHAVDMIATRCQNAAFAMIVLDGQAETDLLTQLQTWIAANATVYSQLPANVIVAVNKCDEIASDNVHQSDAHSRFENAMTALYHYCQTLPGKPEIYTVSAQSGMGVENLFVTALKRALFLPDASPKSPSSDHTESKERPPTPVTPALPDMSFVNYLLKRLNFFGKAIYVDIKSGLTGTHHLARAAAVREGLKAYDDNRDRLDLIYNQLELLGAKDIPPHAAPKTSVVKAAYIHSYWTDPANMEHPPSQGHLSESGYYQELVNIRLGLEKYLRETAPQKKL